VRILIVSPHRDDACFSLALTLEAWAVQRHAITVLDCFTRSRNAPYADLLGVHENDELSFLSAVARREEESFRRRFRNLAILDLNLKDAAIRLRCAPEELCTRAFEPTDTAVARIRSAVETQIATGRVDAMLLPLGIGGNVDHVTVREAALPLAERVPVGFYEDMPYVAWSGGAADEVERAVAELCTRTGKSLLPMSHTVPDAVRRKRSYLLSFPSQVNDDEATELSEFATKYGGAERIWISEEWKRLADGEQARLKAAIKSA
jgi:LmbE family N-acetylglucosaminyl deacetylase